MKILHKNEGTYVDYSLRGNILSFRGGKLTLDLGNLQRDYQVSICISEDKAGNLTLSAAWRYVAEIELPARRSIVEKTGVADDHGFPVLRRVYLPLNTEDVVLTLWAVKEAE